MVFLNFFNLKLINNNFNKLQIKHFRDKTLAKSLISGGENGIRTHDRVSSIHAFQACAFNHSATSPVKSLKKIYLRYLNNSS